MIPLEQRRYRVGANEVTSEQFVIADEDGYLLRFFADIPADPQIS